MRQIPLLAALITGALAVTSCGIDDPYQDNAQTTPASARRAAAPPTTTAADAQEVKPALSPAQAQARHRAERVARRFLAGYLPYSYGRVPTRSIRGATPALRRELATNRPRVSATTMRSAQPRVRQLRVSGLDRSRAYVLAQVNDGSRTYATSLTIRQHGGRWLVTEVH